MRPRVGKKLLFFLPAAAVADPHQDYFKNDTLALIGYGSQGHGQGLNLRDNGLNVIVGVRKNGQSWKDAQQDGWVPGKNLFEVDEAISRGTIVMNLLSDAAQSETWPAIKPQLTEGKVRLLLFWATEIFYSVLFLFFYFFCPVPLTRLGLFPRSDPLLFSRLFARLQGPHQG